MEQYASVYNLPSDALTGFLNYLKDQGYESSPGETRSIHHINGKIDPIEIGRVESSIRGSRFYRVFVFNQAPSPHVKGLERLVADYQIPAPKAATPQNIVAVSTEVH